MASRTLLVRDAIVAAIGQASIADGYANNLAGRVQGGLEVVSQAQRPYVLVALPSQDDDDEVVHDLVQVTAELQIVCEPEPPADGAADDGTPEDRYQLLVADIKRALYVAADLDPPLGVAGCQALRIRGHEVLPRRGDVVFDGAILFGEVVFRHNRLDPGTFYGSTS